MTDQSCEIYYDPNGDFLEVTFGDVPEQEGSEELEPGVFLTRDTRTQRITAVGIFAFKRRADLLKQVLARLKLRLPLDIRVAATNSSQ